MNTKVAHNLKNKFVELKEQKKYKDIARLISHALTTNSSKSNKEIFGYIPQIFREIPLKKNPTKISAEDIYLGEPVIYKVFYPNGRQLYDLPYFYIFCYLKEQSDSLNVYFQSADSRDKDLNQKEYNINSGKINFEGIISAFEDNLISSISISDPGHFFPGRASSYYVGSEQINFSAYIAQVVENIAKAVEMATKNIFLFGSSAGSLGALLSSTYFSEKVNLLAVNSQIFTYKNKPLMEMAFGLSDRKTLMAKFGDRISCLHRFQENITSVPNIYILANLNDKLYPRNFEFYRLYQRIFATANQDNQSIFDSYVGVEGHSRPNKRCLKRKIAIAREVLMMNHVS